LAGAAKGLIKVAYWDTEQGSRPPRLLGEFKGTPTIRMFKPKRKQKKPEGSSEKVVMDYNGERKAKDMKTFLEYSMPNYMDRIVFPQDLSNKSLPKAAKYGLATAMMFPSKNKTSSMMKFLSTIFRRRLLMVEVVPNDANQKELYDIYGISSKEDLPILVVIPSDDTTKFIRYEGEDFSRHKLERFLSEYATKKPVYKAMDTTTTTSDESTTTLKDNDEESSTKKQKVHTEF